MKTVAVITAGSIAYPPGTEVTLATLEDMMAANPNFQVLRGADLVGVWVPGVDRPVLVDNVALESTPAPLNVLRRRGT